MPVGTVKYWFPGQSQGAILGPGTQLLHFTDRDLNGLSALEVQKGMEVSFDDGPDGTARNVRTAKAPVLNVPGELDKDHPLLTNIPLPRQLREILKQPGGHPGLRLDKYLTPAVNQEQQKDRLKTIAQHAVGDTEHFAEVARQRLAMLDDLGATPWSRTTSGPLTLHLARASALENAGLCLHAIHGFPILPGTGLKGLARAFAETIWLPDQPDPTAARAAVEGVFGKAAVGASLEDEPDGSRAGSVVFHDAWPESWPRLIVDIVNNHHVAYYQGKNAPGDWESPDMVYFLAVPADQAFSFALGKRRDDVADDLLKLACEWLDDGLTHLGCGAKTAAGYGRFLAVEGRSARLDGPRVAKFSTELTLTTPAFLAGADQTSEQGCDLRPATVRGLLRWWWRTLHAGYLDVATLRALEAALWGDTAATGAIQLMIEASQTTQPLRYSYKDGYRVQRDFKGQHGLADLPDRSSRADQSRRMDVGIKYIHV